MNKVQTYNWIIKVINSCETLTQTNNCIKLAKAFEIRFLDAPSFTLLMKEINSKFILLLEEQKVEK